METFLAQGVDGIVLAPLDDRALAPVVRDARAPEIPVTIIDSALDSQDYVSFIATDNERAGALAAERLGTLLGGRATCWCCATTRVRPARARESGSSRRSPRSIPGSGSSRRTVTAAPPPSPLMRPPRTCCPLTHVGRHLLPERVDHLRHAARPRSRRTSGKIRFVGFDASQKLVEALGQGKIDGLVVQNPFRMGELGVHAIIDAIAGRSVEPRVDTGATMVTRDNMSEPPIKILLRRTWRRT